MAVDELRLVVTVDDFDAAMRLYRDALCMPELSEVVSGDQGRIAILEAGRATLEIVDAAHSAYVDEVEVGRPVGGHVRLALGVDDVGEALAATTAAGASVIAPPVRTPWDTRNVRLDEPARLQLTLFGPDTDIGG